MNGICHDGFSEYGMEINTHPHGIALDGWPQGFPRGLHPDIGLVTNAENQP